MPNPPGADAAARLDLADWRRRVAELYAEIRAAEDPRAAWERWRAVRDDLFRTHPQSPIPPGERSGFEGLRYFDYDPGARVNGRVEDAPAVSVEIPTSGTAPMRLSRFGVVNFEMGGMEHSLDVFWLDDYAGGIFLSFRDALSSIEVYGACRYLLDTAKGADLGERDGHLVLDFNFAYNPSCTYDPRWVCPLAPPANRLALPVRAGERL